MKTRRQLRRERKAARLAKPTKKPHPETIKRRRRKEEQQRASILPVCPIGRDEIKEADRIFVSQSNLVPGKPHPATLGRWIKFGVPLHANTKSRLKLPAFRMGSRRWTSLKHFMWWQQQLDQADQAS